MADGNSNNLIELATELTIAWLSNPNNRAVAEDVPAFLQKMHSTVSELSNGLTGQDATAGQNEAPEHVPAVTARKSLASKDHIISMIDGKSYKMLRRHLTGHGLTPDEYRERFKLRPDYPMVAESYSEHRRALAKKIGLGSRGQPARSGAKRAGAAAAPEGPTPANAPRTPRTRAAASKARGVPTSSDEPTGSAMNGREPRDEAREA